MQQQVKAISEEFLHQSKDISTVNAKVKTFQTFVCARCEMRSQPFNQTSFEIITNCCLCVCRDIVDSGQKCMAV